MDNLTKIQRHHCMSKIRSNNTKVEKLFRNFIWQKGIRGYRTHNTCIAGNPDLFFRQKETAVFIDGCFWHKCPSCFIKPKSNNGYWDGKIENNIKRDKKISRLLKNNGIVVFRFWEHEIKENIEGCYETLVEMLNKRK